MQALMRGYRENVNIMSLSIAGGIGWLDISPSQILIEFLTSKGIHVVVANGNDGTEGAFFASSCSAPAPANLEFDSRRTGMFFSDSPAATVGGTAVGSVCVLLPPS